MTKEIEGLRAKIGEIKRELRRLRAGDVPAPLDVVFQRIDALIAARASEGESFLRLTAESSAIREPDLYIAPNDPRAVEAVNIAVSADAYRTKLRALATSHYADIGATIDPATVPARIDELEAELQSLERREFAACTKAGIPPRADTNPAILLGIA